MQYKTLNKQVFNFGEFSIRPIRMEDSELIMKWRNEQIYHLRQEKPLTKEVQNAYFNTVVAALFDKEQPEQLLFSFFYNQEFVGYGGLVHINWTDKNAEVSFIMNTEHEKDFFELYWVNYLKLIEELAFKELKFHKIFIYAFDLRPHLYKATEFAGFKKEAVLKEHCLYKGQFIDVVIHSKINTEN